MYYLLFFDAAGLHPTVPPFLFCILRLLNRLYIHIFIHHSQLFLPFKIVFCINRRKQRKELELYLQHGFSFTTFKQLAFSTIPLSNQRQRWQTSFDNL